MSGPLAAALRVARESIGPEDLLLFAWLAIVGPALSAAFAGGPVFDLDSDRAPAVGLLYVVATVGGIACLLTRGLGEPPLAPDPGQSARGYAPFPFAAAVGLVGSTGVEKLGLGSGEWMLGVGFLAALVSFVGHGALPVLAPEARRAL
ncbi:MAG TPA: hypothetical protein VIV06_02190, partial [Candidatus Limnocylindrales bacterium]